MAKVFLDQDEYYPYTDITDRAIYTVSVEVDDETLYHWKRVLAEFDQVQEEMGEMYDKGEVNYGTVR